MTLPRSFGPYTLLNRIAVGGMAEVYVAKTQGLGGFEKQVALKLVHPHLAADEHFVQMLVDEAKVLVKLSHANIAQVLDLGRIDNDYYIAMEYVHGWDLHEISSAARALSHALPPELAAFTMAQVCSGLDYAHRKRDEDGRPLNLVHRDVSPQNVLTSDSGEVKLIDFGIAKGTHRREGTEVGVIKGKYNYMSPEQAWADPIDRRSDVFSAGIVLWELLAGRMAYTEHAVPKLIAQVREAEVPALTSVRPDIPPALAAIVHKAVQREARDRYQSAADLGEALRDFVYEHAPTFNARRMSEILGALMDARREAEARGELASPSLMPRLTKEELPPGTGSVIQSDAPAPRESSLPPAAATAGHRALNARGRPTPPPMPIPVPPAATGSVPPGPTGRPRRRSLPPLPFDSIPPPTERTTAPAIPSASERPAASGSEAPAAPALPWGGAPIGEEGPDTTLVDGSSAVRAAADELLGGGERQEPGAPVLAPGFDTEPTGQYRPRHAMAMARQGQDARGGALQAFPPPASGSEVIPSMPPTAPLPDMSPDGRMFRPRDWRRAGPAGVVALVVTVLALVIWRSGSAPAPSVLEIVSVPAAATVEVNGKQRAGVTPMRIETFEAGKDYELKVSLPGHIAWAGTYHAASGVVQHIAVLKPLRVELFVATQPVGAMLSIDGHEIGAAPLRVRDLEPGRRVTVGAVLPGYEKKNVTFVVDGNQLRPRLDMNLKRFKK